MDEIVLTLDKETGAWTEKKEPYCTVEFDTKEDFDFFNAAIKFYREYLEKAEEAPAKDTNAPTGPYDLLYEEGGANAT